MDEQKKKKRVRLPLRAYLLYLLLVTFALTGVTFSRYVVSSDWGDGARVASIRQLTVTETGDVPAEGGKWLLAPGVDVTKNAVVALESSEVACYVFAEVQTGGWQRSGTHSYAIEDGAGKVLSAWRVETAWQFLSGGTDSAVYYQLVPANTAFSAAVLGDGRHRPGPGGVGRGAHRVIGRQGDARWSADITEKKRAGGWYHCCCAL